MDHILDSDANIFERWKPSLVKRIFGYPWYPNIHRDVFFFMYNRYLAPSNCENHRHGSVSGCRNRIFSVIDNCSASGQLLIDSFQFSVLFLSLLFFRDGEKKKMSDRKDLENMSIMLRRRKKKAFCKNFNDFEDSKNIKINVSRILSKDIRKDINM